MVRLVLSDGGAKGFAHAGVIDAWDEHGIRPDVIARTQVPDSFIAFEPTRIDNILYADGVPILTSMVGSMLKRIMRFFSWAIRKPFVF